MNPRRAASTHAKTLPGGVSSPSVVGFELLLLSILLDLAECGLPTYHGESVNPRLKQILQSKFFKANLAESWALVMSDMLRDPNGG